MADAASTSSIATLIAAIAILPPLVGNVLTWAKDLNVSAKRQRILDEAIKRVTFWDSWMKAMGGIEKASDSDKEQYLSNLIAAQHTVEQISIRDKRDSIDNWIPTLKDLRISFLAYRGGGLLFQIIRLIYYFYLLSSIPLVLVGVGMLFSSEARAEFPPSTWFVFGVIGPGGIFSAIIIHRIGIRILEKRGLIAPKPLP